MVLCVRVLLRRKLLVNYIQTL